MLELSDKDFKAAIITKLQEIKKCEMNGKIEVLSREIFEVKDLLKNILGLPWWRSG